MKKYLNCAVSVIASLFIFSIIFQVTDANAQENNFIVSRNDSKSHPSIDITNKTEAVKKVSLNDLADSLVYFIEPALTPAWWHFEDTVKFDFNGGNIPPKLVTLSGVVTDVSGNKVANVKTNITRLKSNGWTWKARTPGYYEVKFSFFDKSGKEEILNRPVMIRTKEGEFHVFPREKQGFGVLPTSKPFEKSAGQFGFTYSNNPVELALAKLIGFDLVRLLCDWGASFTNLHRGIESVRGHYNWQIFDKKVDLFAKAGFVLNTQFCYTPLWASPFPEKTNINICVVEGTTYAPKDMSDFSRFVEAAVGRYKDRISLWEIWNEPSVPGGSIFWSDTPENFVKLLEAGYKAVKKVQPESQVWLGGLGPRAPYHVFYNKILQLGASNYFDVLSLHGAWNTPTEEFRSIEENNQVSSKPAVSGEWHAILQGNMQSEPILSESALSFKMMKDLLYQIKQGISRTMLFELVNLSEKETLPFAIEHKIFTHSSGLFRKIPQLEPRHAAIVMTNFLQATGRKATFKKDFKIADNTVSLELETDNGPIIVFWNNSTPIKMGPLTPFTTSSSVLRDWEGKPIPINTSKLLDTNKIYYLSGVNTNAIEKAQMTNNLVSPRSKLSMSHKVANGVYQKGPLFSSIESTTIVSPALWIRKNWKSTIISGSANDNKFSARAAVGLFEKGVDIVVEVQDRFHFQNVFSKWKNGDNIQIAIDCEGKGLSGGNTEILFALTEKGPLAWKTIAADPLGDIPSGWSSANGVAKFVNQSITHKDELTRYQIRIPWSELYPLVYDTKKPLRLSILVNNNNGSGKIESLGWGDGINDKNPSKYGLLNLISVSSSNK